MSEITQSRPPAEGADRHQHLAHQGEGTMSDTLRSDRENLFQHLADPAATPGFFERVAEDVDWTVEGTHPLAGRYRSKAAFSAATFDRLTPLMQDGVALEVTHLFVDGDTTIAELHATSTTRTGAPFDNTYCWVCRFDSAEPGASIVEVRAYLDSAMVAWAVTYGELHHP